MVFQPGLRNKIEISKKILTAVLLWHHGFDSSLLSHPCKRRDVDIISSSLVFHDIIGFGSFSSVECFYLRSNGIQPLVIAA